MTTIMQDAELRGDVSFSRQKGFYDPTARDDEVTVIGAGGIGSPTALALAKLGIPKLILWDDDTVERYNLPNQMFPPITPSTQCSNLGRAKVDVLSEVVDDFSPATEVTRNQRRLDARPRGVVVSGVDSMESRQDIWQYVKMNLNVPLYVDARIGGQKIVLYCVNPTDMSDVARYEDTLIYQDGAEEAPCTMRSVIDVGFVTAGLIVRAVRRHLAGEDHEPMVFFNQEKLNVTVA